jgi:hypothetical protein
MQSPSHRRIGNQLANTVVVNSNDAVIKSPPAGLRFFIAAALFLLGNVLIYFIYYLLRLWF